MVPGPRRPRRWPIRPRPLASRPTPGNLAPSPRGARPRVRRPSSSGRNSRSRNSRSVTLAQPSGTVNCPPVNCPPVTSPAASQAAILRLTTCPPGTGTDEAGIPRTPAWEQRSNPREASLRGRNQRGSSPHGKTAGVRITVVRTRCRRTPGAWTRLVRITAVRTLAVKTLPVKTLPVKTSAIRRSRVGTRAARIVPFSPIKRSSRRWRRCPLTAWIGSMPPGPTRRCRTFSPRDPPASAPRARGRRARQVHRARKAPRDPRVSRGLRDRDPRGLRAPEAYSLQGHKNRACLVRAPLVRAPLVRVCQVLASSGSPRTAAASKDRVAPSATAARGILRPGARRRVRSRPR
jgi:hypothetical protein